MKSWPYPVDPRGFVYNTKKPAFDSTWNVLKNVLRYAPYGPPWIFRIMGYCRPASYPTGLMSQPSTWLPSVSVQASFSAGWRLTSASHSSLNEVTGRWPLPSRRLTNTSAGVTTSDAL